MYYTTQKEMNLLDAILDAKTIFGWSTFITMEIYLWFQTSVVPFDWSPFIVAVCTGIYMLAKAYVHVRDGANRGKKDIDP